jgi:hypothetical protein
MGFYFGRLHGASHSRIYYQLPIGEVSIHESGNFVKE